VTHAKDIILNGENPTLMFVYGAYGTHFKPEWMNEYLPLLERGLVVAIAHVRGGGEKGNNWYVMRCKVHHS
jgi:oligopeptidase B